MSAPRDRSGLIQGPRDEARIADDKLVDEYVRFHFGGTQPPEDEPALAGDPSEDEQFNAYMDRHFPGRTGTGG